MASNAPGIPMEGMVPADKLAAPSTHSITALRSYIPALDGVRGLAVLAVMLCHFVWYAPESQTYPIPDSFAKYGVEALKTGRYGVDLFFVLSGFLITGILFDAKNDKHYFRNFYARRTLRIFPLYYGALLLMFVILPRFMSFDSPGEQRIIESQGWLWLYMSNMKSAFVMPEYWQQGKLWMGHFWSLAIEEQFYLVWPLVILLLNRRQAMIACVLMIFGAPLVRMGLFLALQPTPAEAEAGAPLLGLYATIFFTLSKVDTLAIGALMALSARSPGGITRYAKLAPWTLILAGVLLAPMLVLKYPKFGFVGAFGESAKLSLICLFCGSLLVLAANSTPKQLIGWFFTLGVMRFLGKYSYGLYVWHELLAPLFHGRLGAESLDRALGLNNWYLATGLNILIAGTISILIALISWNILEKHMLKLKRFFEHAPESRVDTKAAPQRMHVSAVAATPSQ